jgi:hypothetical protein
MSPRTLLLIALAGLAPGCASVDDLATVVAAATLDCEDIVCGNAAALDDHPFWELDQSKTSYSPVGGFRIESFSIGVTALTLRVEGFRLLGLNGSEKIGPQGLVGSKLVIESRWGSRFELTLEQVGSIPYVELGNAFPDPPIPTYLWRYRRVEPLSSGPDKYLCPSDNIHQGTKDAVMFAGDRYSKPRGTVIATGRAAEPWFNIACNDAALWKMAVFRFVDAARRLPKFDTELEDRKAMVRAIRADYCGNNVAWTDPGTPVDWANRGGWLKINTYPDVEAIWDENGAICLSKPRLKTFAEITCWLDHEEHYCTDDQINNWVADGHRIITYVP